MADDPQAPHAALRKKLQLKLETVLWTHPAEWSPEELAGDETLRRGDLDSADAAIAYVDSEDAVDAFMGAHAERLAEMRLVWLVYPKGNVAPINRDSLWRRLLAHGWRANSNVAFDAELSAIRSRPLKPGERAELPG